MTPAERSDLISTLREVMTSTTGSMSDLVRAVMAATTDGLIDAHKRMTAAGMPDYMVSQAMELLIGTAKRSASHGPLEGFAIAMPNEGDSE